MMIPSVIIFVGATPLPPVYMLCSHFLNGRLVVVTCTEFSIDVDRAAPPQPLMTVDDDTVRQSTLTSVVIVVDQQPIMPTADDDDLSRPPLPDVDSWTSYQTAPIADSQLPTTTIDNNIDAAADNSCCIG